MPKAAYAQNTTRYDSSGDHEYLTCNSCTSQPKMMVPDAVPARPAMIYQVNTLLRSDVGIRCEMVDSSIALNGPISLPLQPVSVVRSNVLSWANPPRTDDTEDACQHQDPVVAA